VETQLQTSQEVSMVEGTSGAVEGSRFREWQQETALQGLLFFGSAVPAS
jgi:hypothetical protein